MTRNYHLCTFTFGKHIISTYQYVKKFLTELLIDQVLFLFPSFFVFYYFKYEIITLNIVNREDFLFLNRVIK